MRTDNRESQGPPSAACARPRRGARAALAGAGAGADVVRRHARPPGGARSRRGQRGRVRLGRGVVQLPRLRRRASRPPDRDGARAARRRPVVRVASGGVRRAERETAVLAIQSGEPGPIAQAIAAIDIAMHDLAARRAGLPLWRHLLGADAVTGVGGRADERAGVVPARGVRVYASGINPDGAGETVEALRRAGHTAFKLKVGFDHALDVANLAAVRAAAGTGAMIMVDANQAWDVDAAIDMSRRFAEHAPGVARGAAARGPAVARMATPRAGDVDSARRWRERQRQRSVRRPDRIARDRDRAARRRQVGRRVGDARRQRPNRRCGAALLSALPRRGHRPARLCACRRRSRQRGEPPRGRLEPEPAANAALPRARRP